VAAAQPGQAPRDDHAMRHGVDPQRVSPHHGVDLDEIAGHVVSATVVDGALENATGCLQPAGGAGNPATASAPGGAAS